VNLIDRLVERWRQRWMLSVGLACGATLLFVTVAASRAIGGTASLAIGVGAALGLAFLLIWRRRRVDALVVARHLNRSAPALEDSADLLVRSTDELSPVQRMQRARVERTLRSLVPPPRLPSRGLRLAATFAAAAVLGALGMLAIAPSGGDAARPSSGRTAPAARGSVEPLQVAGIQITIRPPAYTGKRLRQTDDWDLDAEQGARITWRVQTNRPVHDGGVLLVTTAGDTIVASRNGADAFDAAMAVEHSLLYQVLLRPEQGAMVATSDYHRLTMIPDAPPTVTVVRPEPRTEIPFGSAPVVALEVLAGDDYGVADARIVATLTTGAGEAVKFREQVLEFDTRSSRGGPHPGLILRRTLNPAALAMQPGDELYFFIQVHDNRLPEPNETRSETFFVSLADTAHVVLADWSGLAVNAVPEYLRSQRQIIIDTETLLAQAASLTPQTLRDRSNNIGIDQHVLRERYGEIVGQENVVAGTEPVVEHEHDTPESATLLAQTVKDTLQAAVAQMWEAELRLRTNEPRAALPFEYRALELLKSAQQAARVYVKRVGFEPPPLEPDRKRLTGNLGAIGNPTSRRDLTAAASLPSVRAALAMVQRRRAGGSTPSGAADALERAGQEIAQLAVTQPGVNLETLADLRTLIDALRSGRSGPCVDCWLRLERGLWRALPAADLEREPRARDPGGVARDYFDRLQRAGVGRPR
jgi:hypothetical protein